MAIEAPARSSSLDEVDLNDLGLFADGPPHALFARMRAEAPVHWNAPSHGLQGYWSLTRYEDIVAVNKNWEDFSNARKGIAIREGGIIPKQFTKHLFSMMDPPEHSRHRGILQKVFTARAIALRAQDIRRVANELIDGVIEAGEADLVRDIAEAFPLTVTSNMLGVPKQDHPKLFAWTNDMADTTLTQERMMATMGELFEYVTAMIAKRREQPREDLLSWLIAAEVDGDRLDDVEIVLHFAQLMAGGNETTRNAFAGGMLALMEDPEQTRLLIREPALMPVAVEEVLRWHTPIMYMARTATREIELGAATVAEDDLVVLWHASGNRDEAANPDPDRFDITRPKVNHSAFGGGGIHFCLGNQLARSELSILFGEFLRRIGDAELSGPVERHPSNIFHWMKSVPVSFSPGRRLAV